MYNLTNREKNIIFDKFNPFEDAKCNYPGNIDILVKLGIDLNIQEKYTKKTLLIVCCEYNKIYFFERLIQQNDLNFESKDNNNMNALMHACFQGNHHIVEKLLEKQVNIHQKDKFGRSTLLLSCIKGDLFVVKKLILYGANLEDTSDNGYNALVYAVMSGNRELVKYLILNCKMCVNFKSHLTGFTPLMMACKKNYKEIVKILLNENVDINSEDYINKNKAVSFTEDYEIIRLLSKNKKRKLQ